MMSEGYLKASYVIMVLITHQVRIIITNEGLAEEECCPSLLVSAGAGGGDAALSGLYQVTTPEIFE